MHRIIKPKGPGLGFLQCQGLCSQKLLAGLHLFDQDLHVSAGLSCAKTGNTDKPMNQAINAAGTTIRIIDRQNKNWTWLLVFIAVSPSSPFAGYQRLARNVPSRSAGGSLRLTCLHFGNKNWTLAVTVYPY